MLLRMAITTRWRRPWRSVTSWCIPSVRIIGLLLLLVCLLLRLDDVMNLGVVTQIEAVKIWISHHQQSLSHTHPHWWTFKLKCYIKMSPTSLVSSTRLSLPTTMSMTLTTNTHVLNDVRHVESIKIFDIDPHHHSIWHPSWRKFQPKWYILM